MVENAWKVEGIMMTVYDYKESLQVTKECYSFGAMLMALMRKADSKNMAKIEAVWPVEVAEFKARSLCRGGVLPEEEEHFRSVA